jgi:nucleotide-binding universal stress UspA family protein
MSIFPTKILLATDGSREAELAASTAIDLARETGSELHVLHVLAWPLDADLIPSSFDPELREQLQAASHDRLQDLVGMIKDSGGEVWGSHLAVGRPDSEIVGYAEEIGAGLIVMGSRGLGVMRRAFTGSVSDSVVHHAHCPVMVVRGDALAFPTTILLATDGSEEATLAASTATDVAATTGSELHVVYVGHMPNVVYESPAAIRLEPELRTRMEELAREKAMARVNELTQKIREAGGEVAEMHARAGYPDAQIVGLAGRLGAGLIILGSRGLGPLRRALMGSVSSGVVHHAHCPVLVVREPSREG